MGVEEDFHALDIILANHQHEHIRILHGDQVNIVFCVMCECTVFINHLDN